jgi:hypothetical protein
MVDVDGSGLTTLIRGHWWLFGVWCGVWGMVWVCVPWYGYCVLVMGYKRGRRLEAGGILSPSDLYYDLIQRYPELFLLKK